ncbi:hypothetical protein TWF696_002725 [Orbilia brochopaga]|uniref:Apple domain-containing protein n=1 Tax=Orbilia brochopaga TaxID=3140254 RepID=A0AAV9U1P5_9PEZI
MKYLLPVLGVAATASAAVLQRDCPGDNCVRAVRNPTRPGAADCSSYLQRTVTPATVTFYVTNTESYVATSTDPQTLTNTIAATVTETVPTTLVVTLDSTATITKQALGKRQETEIPSNIPTYASPCAGASRYSSACSCIGVLPTAITVAAPSTTVTLSTTVSLTEVVLPTLATIAITVTDHTVTTVRTDATRTENIATVTIEPQCANLAASPVNYQQAGKLIIAGVGGSRLVSEATSAQDCCSSCYRNGFCFGFSWGNFDPTWYNINDFNQQPPVSPNQQCYHFVFVNTALGCYYDGVAFGPTRGQAPPGGAASFGYGGCRVSAW